MINKLRRLKQKLEIKAQKEALNIPTWGKIVNASRGV